MASTAYWAEGSVRLISGRLRASPGSTARRAAKVTGRSYLTAQSLSNVCTPDFPARAAAHVLGTSPPSGVVAPMPVTTTSGSLVTVPPGQVVGGSSSPRAGGWAVRGVRGASDGLVGRRTSPARSVLRARDEGHGVADGGEVLDLVVGDADRELLLGEGDDRHHRQGVDVEVVGEGLLRRDGVSGQPGLLADDLGQAGQDLLLAVRHRCLLVRWCRCRKASGRARFGQLVGTPMVRGSGQYDHLGRIDEPRAEADLQGEGAAADLSFAQQALGGERDGRGGRVAGLGDVPADHHPVSYTHLRA